MTNSETRARNRLSSRTTAQLILDWELTEILPMTPELPIVRGWIMDEFERRDQIAFDAWSEDEDPDASPPQVFSLRLYRPPECRRPIKPQITPRPTNTKGATP